MVYRQYNDTLKRCQTEGLNPSRYLFVVPVPFSSQGAKMLQHTKAIVEDPDGIIAIDRRFEKLIESLNTAVATEYKLEKEKTKNDDLLDALRLNLRHYQFK